MKILWFPRLQFDMDHLHLVTWREMARALEQEGHCVRVAIAGIPKSETPPGWIRLPLCPIPVLRLLGFWLFGYAAFLWQRLAFRPELVILDIYTAGFGFPWAGFSPRTTWLLDQRTPIAHTSIRRGALRHAWEQTLTWMAMALARTCFDGMTTITEAFRGNGSASGDRESIQRVSIRRDTSRRFARKAFAADLSFSSMANCPSTAAFWKRSAPCANRGWKTWR